MGCHTFNYYCSYNNKTIYYSSPNYIRYTFHPQMLYPFQVYKKFERDKLVSICKPTKNAIIKKIKMNTVLLFQTLFSQKWWWN